MDEVDHGGNLAESFGNSEITQKKVNYCKQIMHSKQLNINVNIAVV